VDNFGVAVSYGSRRIAIPLPSNLLIALCNAAGAYASILAGGGLGAMLGVRVAAGAGALLLMAIGGLVLAGSARLGRTGSRPRQPIRPLTLLTARSGDLAGHPFLRRHCAVRDHPAARRRGYDGAIGPCEGYVLALALTPSNLSSGLAAGLMGFDPRLAAGLTCLASLLAIAAGLRAGLLLKRYLLGRYATAASGLMLIGLGLYEGLSQLAG
jgi:putative sporulation protein YtaF